MYKSKAKLREIILKVKEEEERVRMPGLADELTATMAVLAWLERYEGTHPILGPLAERKRREPTWVPASSQIRRAHQAIVYEEQRREQNSKPKHNSLSDPREVGINIRRRRRRSRD